MIDTITIKNFRCFASVQLSGCRRINVIVGKNASGKTALLEAIFLAAGSSPDLTLKIRSWRGREVIVLSLDRSDYEALWKDLFCNLDQDETISIEFTGSSGFRRSLVIGYEQAPQVLLPLGDDISASQFTIPISFTYTVEDGKPYKTSPILTQKGLKIDVAPLPPIKALFLASQVPFHAQQYAAFFSQLSKQRKQHRIIEPLQTEFPFIKEITLETEGTASVLYAQIDDLPEKIPVALSSAGVHKLLCILLGIAAQAKGVVLIDEVENGFYFDRLPSIWKLILDISKEYDVQVFATTHSSECLQSLATAMEGNNADFSLIRTITEDGIHTTEQFDGKTLLAALRQHGEIR